MSNTRFIKNETENLTNCIITKEKTTPKQTPIASLNQTR